MRLLRHFLAFLARGVIERQRPLVIGVTGSVGKTSAKIAIGAVVGATRRVRASPKNYNNEIGFPVAVIGGGAPGRSPFMWLSLVVRGFALALFRSATYPETLVLEYGADHPGDIAALTTITRPNIAVLTAIGAAHTEFFHSVDGVAEEKWRLIAALPPNGIAVLNADDPRVMALRPRTQARVVTYGLSDGADVRGSNVAINYAQATNSITPIGITFVMHGHRDTAVALSGVLGHGHVTATLAGAAVGHALGLPVPDIAHGLARYAPPPGRMRIIPGIKGTSIIDDTYNASPLAMVVALDALAGVQTNGRRIVVLGDMLELGSLTEREHYRVGELVAARSVEHFVCVGAVMKYAASGARAARMPEDRVHTFDRADAAGRFVQDLLQSGDVVLVKASQGIRLERVVQELMAEPLRAQELLCRQDMQWRE